jgi:gas vesicle protein
MAKSNKFAVGALMAGLAGYLAGVLTAPKSGKQTRDDIKDNVSQRWSEAEKELKTLHTELAGRVEDLKTKADILTGKAQNEVNDLLTKARASKEKVRAVLSAIHEGDAQDVDLQKALKEANLALDHIKSYFKK